MKKILIAANRQAGKGRGAKVLQHAVHALLQNGVVCEVLLSEYDGHLLQALPARLTEKWDTIVALGGDGTLFQVINCCLHTPGFTTPLALLPAGTGNSFSKELTGEAIESAWRKIISDQPTAIDVIHCRPHAPAAGYPNGYYFITALGLGFVSEVTVNALRFKRLGVLAYALSVLTSLIHLKTTHMKMVLDGETIVRENVFVIVCNSRYAGGNMKIAPGARLDDGLMEVIVLNKVNRRTVIRAFPSVFSGTHVHHPNIEIFSGEKLHLEADPVQILTPDGEVAGQTPATLTVQPQCLKFIL